MLFALLADAAVLIHLAFIGFVLGGGFLAVRWPRIVWGHLPAAGWAFFVEASGRVCPLTPLENWLRLAAGEVGYRTGFLEHYILPILYPPGLTRQVQWQLACVVVAVNLAAYVWVWSRWRRGRMPGTSELGGGSA